MINTRFLLILLALAVNRTVWADDKPRPISADDVRKAMDRGVKYLRSQQDKIKGNWMEYPAQPGGVTSLVTLALLNAGEDPKDPAIQRALSVLRAQGNPEMTYATALQTMVFCAAEPDQDRLLISRNVRWLESVQLTSEDRGGSWAYSGKLGKGDNSNTQFAMLALHEAERVGVKVSEQTWRRSLNFWLKQQKEDGSWGYFEDQPTLGSMTCAGIASVVIASGRLSAGDVRVNGGSVECCREHEANDAVERGLQWLGQKFSPDRNPNALSGVGPAVTEGWLYYYLYGVERVGRLTGRRFLIGQSKKGIERHDWYREVAEQMIRKQDALSGNWKGAGHGENHPIIATSFALLFLSKGRWPVLISKLQYRADQDWDTHRGAVHNLTQRVEKKWRRNLTWQTIDSKAADVADLLQTPVLFISGRAGLSLSEAEKKNLREYVNQGGFIFAESCCDGEGFDRDFRSLMKELFPDSSLRLLPPDHPVWYAEEKVDPKYLRPLYGVDTCCRTGVVYCPKNLSCYWELSRGTRESDYPPDIQDEIEACLRIGVNVLAYATNRQLKDKLDRPYVPPSDPAAVAERRDELYIPKLSHGGGSDDAPNALLNLLGVASRQVPLNLRVAKRLVSPTDERLYEHPVLFVHGRREFTFSAAERKSLADYLRNGGFLFGDAICASGPFAEAFRRELKAILPEANLVRLPSDHPLLTPEFRGYNITTVTLRDPKLRGGDEPLETRLVKTAPLLEGVELDGRLVVVFSPHDLSCALENAASLDCKGYTKEDASRIGVNIVLFALQQ